MSAIRTALACGLLAAIAACSVGDPEEGDGRGVVRALDPAGRTITLEHGDIPGLMKAMTMQFDLGEAPPAGIAVGDTVDFRLEYSASDGRYTVTDLREANP